MQFLQKSVKRKSPLFIQYNSSRNRSYITRKYTNIPQFKTNHNFLKNYFFPSTIIEWNNLDPNLQNSDIYETFRNIILMFLGP